jgi:phospholipase/carboxylesterase
VRRERFGDLNVTLFGGPDREGGGDGPLVVLLHGFGAPGTDLVALWRQLDVPHEVRFAFPEALLDLAEVTGIPAYSGARAWWPLDLEALERAARGEERRDRSNEVPEGLAPAREAVVGTLDALQATLEVPEGKLILGGFSQGSMLALDVALRTDRPLAGLGLMSSTLLCRQEWEPLMAGRAGLPVLLSHGRNDPLLPFAAAETLRDLLTAAKLDVRWVEFSGGHTITDGVVEALGALIRDAVAR